MKQKHIDELIEKVLLDLRKVGYNRNVIDSHKRTFNRIREYMNGFNIQLYSESVGESYKISQIDCDKTKSYRFREIKSAVNLLNDTLNDLPMRRKRVSKKVYPMPGEIGTYVENFLEYFKSTELPHDKTLGKYRLALSRFATRMHLDNIRLSTLNELSVRQFISTMQNSRASVYIPLRRFLSFLYENSITRTDLSLPLYHIKRIETEKLPSVYNIDEIQQMEHVIDRNTATGKRDYAIFLLASRLGLRASDIAMFKFSYIDWDNNVIRFQQYKTSQDVELPLLKVVGEAIIDYIKYGRPKSSSKTLFLGSRAPYLEITYSSISAIINNIIRRAKVFKRDRHAGSHSLRHSLATQLLEQGDSLALISDILGHNSTKSTSSYLRVDVNGLLSCSLDVPPVPEIFYQQEGGVFYE